MTLTEKLFSPVTAADASALLPCTCCIRSPSAAIEKDTVSDTSQQWYNAVAGEYAGAAAVAAKICSGISRRGCKSGKGRGRVLAASVTAAAALQCGLGGGRRISAATATAAAASPAAGTAGGSVSAAETTEGELKR